MSILQNRVSPMKRTIKSDGEVGFFYSSNCLNDSSSCLNDSSSCLNHSDKWRTKRGERDNSLIINILNQVL
jgi:hypothetical protein